MLGVVGWDKVNWFPSLGLVEMVHVEAKYTTRGLPNWGHDCTEHEHEQQTILKRKSEVFQRAIKQSIFDRFSKFKRLTLSTNYNLPH